MKKSLKEAINEHIEFSEEEFNNALPNISILTFEKREFLLENGQICDFIGYVKKGLFRSVYTDIKGNERVLQFFMENDWICDFTSLFTEIPSKISIQSMEKSEIYVFDKNENPNAFARSSRFRFLIGSLSQSALVKLQNRYIESMTLSAYDRYVKLINDYPDIQQRVPQHQIASFLGISATFLSLIKKKMFKE